MIKPIPSYTLEDNSKYEYYVGDKPYKVKIVIDELNDSLLMGYSLDLSEWTSCTCNDYMYRKHRCKHIKECLAYLKSVGVEYREEDNEPSK